MATRRFSGGFPSKTLIDGEAIERLRPGTEVEVYQFGLRKVDYARLPIVEVLVDHGRTHECVRLELESGRTLVVSSRQWLWVDGPGHVQAGAVNEGNRLRVRQVPTGGVFPLDRVVATESIWLPRTRRRYLPVLDTSSLALSKRDKPIVGVFANGVLARIN